jgi:hypothetical protein
MVNLGLHSDFLSEHKKTIVQTLKKVAKATVLAVVFYVVAYFFLSFMARIPSEFVPPQLLDNFTVFLEIYMALIVASVLASGTVLEPVFSFAKALAPIITTLLSIDYATVTMPFTSQEATVTISINLQLAIVLLLTISLLNLTRETLHVMSFIQKRVQ